MSNHIKFKGQIISHCILKVFLRRDFIIEIVERMQPFISASIVVSTQNFVSASMRPNHTSSKC